jgi:hypothetical protein
VLAVTETAHHLNAVFLIVVSPSCDTNAEKHCSRMGNCTMSHAKQALTRKRYRKAAPALRGCGIVFITTEWNICSKRCTRTRSVRVECRNEPEEISDVSLGTFYAFDCENVQTDRPARRRFAVGCGGCGCGYGGRRQRPRFRAFAARISVRLAE